MAGRPRSWTDEQLREAVAQSDTLIEVLDRLGLARGGNALTAVRKRMLQLGIQPPRPELLRSDGWNADPATLTTAPSRARKWSDEDLAWAVTTCFSMAQVIAALGLKVGGSVYPALRKRIAELGLDTSHWTGQGWTKGRKNPVGRKGRPLEEILVEASDYVNTHRLKERLITAGLMRKRCEICQLIEWQGKPIPLQLDHINGVRSDNRLENLRILCANCHAQTDTWCGRNIGKVRGTVSER